MPSSAGRGIDNALVRRRRDLRFTLIDRYRALLASRYARATAVVAGAVDLAFGARRAIGNVLERRATHPAGPRLLRVAVSADGLLSLVVTTPAAGDLALRDMQLGDLVLTAITDSGADGLRLVARLPDAAADGHDRTVTMGGTGVVVTDRDILPSAFAVRDGRLVLRGRHASAGRPHTLQIGVGTVVVRWPALDGERLTVGDVEVRARVEDGVGTAEVDLTDIGGTHPAVVGDAGVPLSVTAGPWPSSARPVTPPAVRVTPRPGHTVEVGYTDDGHLEFRRVSSTATAWSS